MGRKARKLSAKHQRFVEEYLVDLNATAAAKRAGYSEKTAYSQGQRLLKNVEIQFAISTAQQQRSIRTEITAARVLAEIALVAFSDIGEVIRVDDQGKVYVRELDGLQPEARRAIGEITQKTVEVATQDGRVVEKITLGVKHHSKVAALKMLSDHLGLSAPKKHELTGKDGGPVEMSGVRYVVHVPEEEPEEQ